MQNICFLPQWHVEALLYPTQLNQPLYTQTYRHKLISVHWRRISCCETSMKKWWDVHLLCSPLKQSSTKTLIWKLTSPCEQIVACDTNNLDRNPICGLMPTLCWTIWNPDIEIRSLILGQNKTRSFEIDHVYHWNHVEIKFIAWDLIVK